MPLAINSQEKFKKGVRAICERYAYTYKETNISTSGPAFEYFIKTQDTILTLKILPTEKGNTMYVVFGRFDKVRKDLGQTTNSKCNYFSKEKWSLALLHFEDWLEGILSV